MKLEEARAALTQLSLITVGMEETVGPRDVLRRFLKELAEAEKKPALFQPKGDKP